MNEKEERTLLESLSNKLDELTNEINKIVKDIELRKHKLEYLVDIKESLEKSKKYLDAEFSSFENK
jgi:hypothetical protein